MYTWWEHFSPALHSALLNDRLVFNFLNSPSVESNLFWTDRQATWRANQEESSEEKPFRKSCKMQYTARVNLGSWLRWKKQKENEEGSDRGEKQGEKGKTDNRGKGRLRIPSNFRNHTHTLLHTLTQSRVWVSSAGINVCHELTSCWSNIQPERWSVEDHCWIPATVDSSGPVEMVCALLKPT